MFDKLQKIARSLNLELTKNGSWIFLRNNRNNLLIKARSIEVMTHAIKERVWNQQLEEANK